MVDSGTRQSGNSLRPRSQSRATLQSSANLASAHGRNGFASQDFDLTCLGMLNRFDHAPMQGLRMIEELLVIENGPAGNSHFVEFPNPPFRRVLARRLRQQLNEIVIVNYAPFAGRETLVNDQIWHSSQAAEAFEERLLSSADCYVAIGRGEDLIGSNAAMCLPHSWGVCSGGEIVDGFVNLKRGRGLKERCFNILALPGSMPGLERCENSDRNVEARREIADGNGQAMRGPVSWASDGHQAGEPLRHDIEPSAFGKRTRLAVTRHRSVYQSRKLQLQALEVEPEPRHCSRPEAFKENVGAGNEVEESIFVG